MLNQLEVDDTQSEGGLGRMLRLLDDAFGSKADERLRRDRVPIWATSVSLGNLSPPTWQR